MAKPSSRKPTIPAPPVSTKSSLSSNVSSRATRPAPDEVDSKGQAPSKVVKLQKLVATSKAKGPAADKVYEMCMKLLDEADEASEKQQTDMDQERQELSRKSEQLRNDITHMTGQINHLRAQGKQALDEKSELEKRLLEMKQALNAASTTNQHQVAWSEVFPVLQQAQNSLLLAAGEVGRSLDALQNKQDGMHLPDSMLYQDSWTSPTAPPARFGSNSLPSLTSHPMLPANPSMNTSQAASQFDHCGLLS